MFQAKLNAIAQSRKSFIFDPLNLPSLGASLLINIIHLLILYFKLGFSQRTILIHYNVVYGSDFVGRVQQAYLIPLTALAILVLNTILSGYFYRREKLASYFLNYANIAVQLIFLAASIIIIRTNG
jgi:hypothetical protein